MSTALVTLSDLDTWKAGIQSLMATSEKSAGDLTSKPTQEKLLYAKIFQPTSSLNTEGGVYETIKLGDMYHPYGVIGKTLDFVPLVFFDSRVKWTDDGSGRVKDCEAPDASRPITTKYATSCGKCPHQAGTRQSPSQCTYNLNAVVVPTNLQGMLVLSFYRSTIRVGEEIKARANQFGDVTKSMFSIKTLKDPKGGSHFVYAMEDQKVVPDEFMEAVKPLQQKAIEMVLGQRKRQYELAGASDKTTSTVGKYTPDAGVDDSADDGEDLDAPDNIA